MYPIRKFTKNRLNTLDALSFTNFKLIILKLSNVTKLY